MYIPKGVSDQLLVLNRARPIIFFKHRMHCYLHNCEMEQSHMLTCCLTEDLPKLDSLRAMVKGQHIADWPENTLLDIIRTANLVA